MTPPSPSPSPAMWRALVEKDLAGKPFDKTLVHATIEGVPIAPLYTEAQVLPRVLGDGAPFRICMRHVEGATAQAIHDDLDGGADALWLPRAAADAVPPERPPHVQLVIDEDATTARVGDASAWLASTLDFHLEGADACDEVALALSTAVARLASAPRPLLARVAVGRDTFVELCKLRALRITIRKVFAALGVAPTLWIHAVASARTVTARDPWVNMLRVTTQLFAAVLGGADLVTPLAFDDALEASAPLGRRVARNTGHVLREESALGRVVDPGAGSYYLDSLTDALARGAWERFRAIERAGGIDAAVASGFVGERLEATRKARADAIAKRKMPVLGVSEFANLGEELPSPPRGGSLLRDGAAFEALRGKFEGKSREVLLVAVGTPAESRARMDFMRALFATVGVTANDASVADALGSVPDVACLCGSDENYAAHAVSIAAELREAGARKIAFAGRPGALEAPLRDAGVEVFVFAGCDAIAALTALLEVTS